MQSTYFEVEPAPYSEYLKEAFSRVDRGVLDDIVAKQRSISNSHLDGIFLREAWAFLRASIFNLMAFKNLMCGNYSAWGKVTLYYSNFYIVNSMLRLNGFAIVHVKNAKGPAIELERDFSSRTYAIKGFGGRDHEAVWKKFTSVFSHLMDPKLYRIDIEDREMWNYDPRYFSQATDRYSLAMAKAYCEYDFLREDFEESASSIEDAENRFNLVSEFGYQEGATAYIIREAIKLLGLIGKASRFRDEYVRELEGMKK